MHKHLTLFELADPNGEVDAIMNIAMFLPSPAAFGDIVEYDGIKCEVLETHEYRGAADYSLQLAIVYPPELKAPEKAEWFCNSTAQLGLYQTRHIFIDKHQRLLDISSVYDFENADLAPSTINRNGWELKDCYTFDCENSPFKHLYVATCVERVLQTA